MFTWTEPLSKVNFKTLKCTSINLLNCINDLTSSYLVNRYRLYSWAPCDVRCIQNHLLGFFLFFSFFLFVFCSWCFRLTSSWVSTLLARWQWLLLVRWCSEPTWRWGDSSEFLYSPQINFPFLFPPLGETQQGVSPGQRKEVGCNSSSLVGLRNARHWLEVSSGKWASFSINPWPCRLIWLSYFPWRNWDIEH